MSNVRFTGFDKSEIDHTVDDTVLILLSGKNSGWFVDCDASLSSAYSNDNQIYRPRKRENKSDTEFSDSGKGWVPILGKIPIPELDIGYGDNDGECDEDNAGDG